MAGKNRHFRYDGRCLVPCDEPPKTPRPTPPQFGLAELFWLTTLTAIGLAAVRAAIYWLL